MNAKYSITADGIKLGETTVCTFWTKDKDGVQSLIDAANMGEVVPKLLDEVTALISDIEPKSTTQAQRAAVLRIGILVAGTLLGAQTGDA